MSSTKSSSCVHRLVAVATLDTLPRELTGLPLDGVAYRLVRRNSTGLGIRLPYEPGKPETWVVLWEGMKRLRRYLNPMVHYRPKDAKHAARESR